MKTKTLDFTDRYDDLVEFDLQGVTEGKYTGERVLFVESHSRVGDPVALDLDQARALRDFLVENL